jgi:hypothetical protein
MKMEIPWMLFHLPTLKLGIRLIGLHSAIALSLRRLNFSTRGVKCLVRISIPWWNFGQRIQQRKILKIFPSHLQILRHSLTIGTCTGQSIQYQSVVCLGKASIFRTMVPSPTQRIPHLGWTLNTQFGSEILAYSSKICWTTVTLTVPSIMQRIGNMMITADVVTRNLCQVTGVGNSQYVCSFLLYIATY